MVETGQRPANIWLQLFLGAWIIGAQFFYFYQYSPAVLPLLRALSRKLWH
jgi:hypothetical protein